MRVKILVQYRLTGPVLHTHQISSKHFKRYWSYREKRFVTQCYPILQEEITRKPWEYQLPFLYATHILNPSYIPTKTLPIYLMFPHVYWTCPTNLPNIAKLIQTVLESWSTQDYLVHSMIPVLFELVLLDLITGTQCYPTKGKRLTSHSCMW